MANDEQYRMTRYMWEQFVLECTITLLKKRSDAVWYRTLEELKLLVQANAQLPEDSGDLNQCELAKWFTCSANNYRTGRGEMIDVKKSEGWRWVEGQSQCI